MRLAAFLLDLGRAWEQRLTLRKQRSLCCLQIKGPRPKSEAFSGSNSVDVPSIPNPFAKADEAKDAVSLNSFEIYHLGVKQGQTLRRAK